jgi:hypothetical protein
MFDRQVRKQEMRALFLEYAWDMAWCDPCSADPLSADELRQLGVFWTERADSASYPGAQNVFLTRLHLRYDSAHFPEDLVFQETADRENFQGRFILRHPWTGGGTCEAARRYRRELPQQYEKQVETLASLTGWEADKIRRKMNLPAGARGASKDAPWWKQLWVD